MLSILAMATAGGSIFGFAATAAKASKTTIAYATAGGAVAGAGAGYYYQEEINEMMSNLLTQPNDPLESRLTELTVELHLRQQQPVTNAHSMHESLLEHHDTLLFQSTEQQDAMNLSLMELGAAKGQTTELTTTLTRLVPSLHVFADEAVLDVQTMHHTTTDLCEQAVLSHHELHNTQSRLMEEEQRFAALVNGLTTTENTFARSRDIEQKIHRLADLQQQTGNAPNRDELLTENTQLKEQIRDLQAKAADTREWLLALSEENDALKKFIHPHEPQRSTPSLTLFARV